MQIKNINNISFTFIMLTDNNQIFRNGFVISYCHLTKVSFQINKCIIFEPNELSITLSTLWYNLRSPDIESTDSDMIFWLGMALLHETFPGRVISRLGDRNWLSWFGVNAHALFSLYLYWGKSKVYVNKPKTIPVLKEEIIDSVSLKPSHSYSN